MSEQLRDALGDRETQAQAALPIARGIPQLHIVVEDCADRLLRNADAGVAHGETDQAVAVLADHSHAAALGIAHSVGDEVGHNAFEERRIGPHDAVFARAGEQEILDRRLRLTIRDHAMHDIAKSKVRNPRLDGAAVELAQIQQDVQDTRHRGQGLARLVRDFSQIGAFGLLRNELEVGLRRLERLTQIVAGGADEPGFHGARRFGFGLCLSQRGGALGDASFQFLVALAQARLGLFARRDDFAEQNDAAHLAVALVPGPHLAIEPIDRSVRPDIGNLRRADDFASQTSLMGVAQKLRRVWEDLVV